ncbi:hypothetical protein GQ457_18G008670 [Hibiscus cannabinus]
MTPNSSRFGTPSPRQLFFMRTFLLPMTRRCGRRLVRCFHRAFGLPSLGTVAIFFDCAFMQDCGAGIRVVVQDLMGLVLVGLAHHSFRLVSSYCAEVLVGLQLTYDRGWDRIVLESNSARVVNKLRQNPGLDLSIPGPPLALIRFLLTAHLLFRVRYVSCNANIVAHTLATWALVCTQSLFFDSICPEIIQTYVNTEFFC